METLSSEPVNPEINSNSKEKPNAEFDHYRNHTFENPGKFKGKVPEGQSDASGPCLRVALFEAGIDTNLPRWVDTGYLEEICEELNIKYYGPGSDHDYPLEGNYVVGYNQQTEEGVEFGHFVHCSNLEEFMEEVSPKNLFAIIEVD